MPFSLSPQPPSTVAAGEELLFTNSSFTTHTGGAIFSSGGGQQQSTMSSSVPVTSVLVSSPLQVRDFPHTTLQYLVYLLIIYLFFCRTF